MTLHNETTYSPLKDGGRQITDGLGGAGGTCNASFSTGEMGIGATIAGIWNPCSIGITATDWTEPYVFAGELHVARAAAPAPTCPFTNEPCFTVSGYGTAQFARVDAELVLAMDSVLLNDSVAAIMPGRTYHFGSTEKPRVVQGVTAGYYVDWHGWVLTRGDGTEVPRPCSRFDDVPVWYMGCYARVDTTSRMTLTALANGKWKTKFIELVLRRDFRLTVDRNDASPGDTATFAPTLDGRPVPVSRWRWVPADSGGDATTGFDGPGYARLKELSASGTMWAYLDYPGGGTDSAAASVSVTNVKLIVTADKALVESGERVRFSARRSDGKAFEGAVTWTWTPGDPDDASGGPAGPAAQKAGATVSLMAASRNVRTSRVGLHPPALTRGPQDQRHRRARGRGSRVTLAPPRFTIDVAQAPAAENPTDGGSETEAWHEVTMDNATAAPVTRSGTMTATTTIGGRESHGSVSVAVKPEPVVTLTCPDSVTRTQEADCGLSVQPPEASVTVQRWYFIPDDNSIVDTVERADENDARQWSGPMVTGGTVYAAWRTLAGPERLASAHIQVGARSDWKAKTPIYPTLEARDTSDMSDRPYQVPDEQGLFHLGHIHVGYVLDNGAIDVVGRGPNTGLAYYKDMPVRINWVVHINYDQFSRPTNGSTNLWTRAPVSHPTIDNANVCTRSDLERSVRQTEPSIEQHEGLGLDPRSHAGRFKATADSLFAVAAERIVVGPKNMDGGGIGEYVLRVLNPAYNAANAESAKADEDFKVNFGGNRCDIRPDLFPAP